MSIYQTQLKSVRNYWNYVSLSTALYYDLVLLKGDSVPLEGDPHRCAFCRRLEQCQISAVLFYCSYSPKVDLSYKPRHPFWMMQIWFGNQQKKSEKFPLWAESPNFDTTHKWNKRIKRTYEEIHLRIIFSEPPNK